jgi:hypothetical protein
MILLHIPASKISPRSHEEERVEFISHVVMYRLDTWLMHLVYKVY